MFGIFYGSIQGHLATIFPLSFSFNTSITRNIWVFARLRFICTLIRSQRTSERMREWASKRGRESDGDTRAHFRLLCRYFGRIVLAIFFLSRCFSLIFFGHFFFETEIRHCFICHILIEHSAAISTIPKLVCCLLWCRNMR